MDPQHWQHIKELLHSALEREPGERSAFLASACAHDDLLRQEIESLITSHEQAGGFIESPAFELMAESLEEQMDPLAGQSFGPYQIIARIGTGGMGEVYSAEDSRLGRKVALKMLPTFFTEDNDRVRRFQQEARAASALNHPNILTIYEIGKIAARHFIATEFIEGETLGRRLTGTQLTISETLKVSIQVASALSAAHQAAIAHRDIKPGNIMLRPDGVVKVLDFGLAKLTEPKTRESEAARLVNTQPGIVMGTAHYMSPEQTRGQQVDARTDIWSLGVVLYEMTTGRLPFEGSTVSDVISLILQKEPLWPSNHTANVPPELERIVTKALRKDREERYQTVNDMLLDLKSLKQDLLLRVGLAPPVPERISGYETGSETHLPIQRAPSRAIAVLPFRPISAEGRDEYLELGMADALITKLSSIRQIVVRPTSSVRKYTDLEQDSTVAGRELKVDSVLEGSIQRRAGWLRVSARLVGVEDGRTLWAEKFDEDFTDIFSVQDSISEKVAAALALKLTGEEKEGLTKRYTENTAAYQLYLKGLHFFNKRSLEGYNKAIEYYQQAIEKDPNYALAYAGLADCYANCTYAEVLPKDAIMKARAAAGRALEIDDSLAEAHNALGHVKVNLDWDWIGAEREFKLALKLNPNYVEAHHRYSHYLVAMGRFEESLVESLRGLELDPVDLSINTHLGWHYLMARQNDQAIEELKKTLELDHSFVRARLYLGQGYERAGMYQEAIAEFKKAGDLYGQRQIASGLLGHTYAVAGLRSEAQRTIEELKEQSKREYVWPYNIAIIHIALGEIDRAFEWLEKACDDRSEDLIYLNVEPTFDRLRSDPRFRDLVRRIGLSTDERHNAKESRSSGRNSKT